jgi:hypothetical protein
MARGARSARTPISPGCRTLLPSFCRAGGYRSTARKAEGLRSDLWAPGRAGDRTGRRAGAIARHACPDHPGRAAAELQPAPSKGSLIRRPCGRPDHPRLFIVPLTLNRGIVIVEVTIRKDRGGLGVRPAPGTILRHLAGRSPASPSADVHELRRRAGQPMPVAGPGDGSAVPEFTRSISSPRKGKRPCAHSASASRPCSSWRASPCRRAPAPSRRRPACQRGRPGDLPGGHELGQRHRRV